MTRIYRQNHENYESLIIPCQNQQNHEIPKIQLMNHENYENAII